MCSGTERPRLASALPARVGGTGLHTGGTGGRSRQEWGCNPAPPRFPVVRSTAGMAAWNHRMAWKGSLKDLLPQLGQRAH